MTRYGELCGRGLLLLSLSAVSAQAATLPELRATWKAAPSPDAYAAVALKLMDYRIEQRFAKSAEVDYMIATSLCRTLDRRASGRDHFDFILANFDLDPDSRETVLSEQRKCVEAQATSPIVLAFNTLPGQAGGVNSKLFYWLGRDDAAVNTDPVTIVDAKTPEELHARLFGPDQRKEAVAKVRTVVGEGFRVIATPNFVMASASQHSNAALEEIGKTLEKYLRFFVDAYRMRFPQYLMTVYLLPNTQKMRALAEKLHGIKINRQSIGYAFRDDMSILGVVPGKAIGTLAHELFHVLVRDRYGDVPPWLDEGVASLYEVSTVSGKYLPTGRDDAGAEDSVPGSGNLPIRGVPNWRGCVLRSLWLERNGPQVFRPTIEQLATMDWRMFSSEGDEGRLGQQAVNHATARYLALYLQDRDKLFAIFGEFGQRDPFRLRGTVKEDALSRVSKHLGGDLGAADAEFEDWLRATVSSASCH